jgi:hypothetical protein
VIDHDAYPAEPRALSGTWLNGLYESHPIGYGERGFGFPEDGQTVVDVTGDRYPLLLHRPYFELYRKQGSSGPTPCTRSSRPRSAISTSRTTT